MATIILKATENCNSNCIYCDVLRKERHVRTMTTETLRLVFQRIDEYLTSNRDERMTIIWHGGEPLLLGAEYFDTASKLQDECCPDTRARIDHAIQSNLTLFDESFVSVFKKLGIDQIGSSYDPVSHVRGMAGDSIDSLTYNRAFMRGDALAKKHGFSSGIICVVTQKSLARPLEIFHYLTNLKLGSGFDFHPVLVDDYTRGDIAVTPKEFVEFLGAIFPVWWQHRGRYPDVDPFKSIHANIAEGKRSLSCCDSGGCSKSHINVAPDGSASHCGRSSDWGVLDYGHISDRTFDEIMADEQRQVMDERTEHLKKWSCGKCRFWTICHGGCPLDSWFTHGDFRHKTNWCYAKKGFIEKYYEPITGIRFAG